MEASDLKANILFLSFIDPFHWRFDQQRDNVLSDQEAERDLAGMAEGAWHSALSQCQWWENADQLLLLPPVLDKPFPETNV